MEKKEHETLITRLVAKKGYDIGRQKGIDLIFSELDKKHREILISMAPKQQTIITTTELPVKNAFVINL